MIGRDVLVGLIVFLVAVPATFVGFAMALVVVELVIFPTMTLVIAVVTALVASWAADSLAADGLHTDLDQTVGRHLVWALVPAALAVLSSFVPLPRASSLGVARVDPCAIPVAEGYRTPVRPRGSRRPGR